MAQISYPTGKKPVVKPAGNPADRNFFSGSAVPIAPKVAPTVNMVRSANLAPAAPASAAPAAFAAAPSMGRAMTVAPRTAPTANLVRPAGLPTPQPLMPKKISPLINQSVGTPPTLKPGGIPLPPPSGFIKGEKNYIDRAGEGYFKRFGTHFTPADVRTKEHPKGRVDPYGFSDAARHAGGASIMASDLGIIPTNIAGLMHELFISGNDVGGWMDLKNNFMGSLAGGIPRLANMLTAGGGASSFNPPGANSESITEEARMNILEYMIRNNWLSTLEENNNFQWFMNEAKNRNAMSGVAR